MKLNGTPVAGVRLTKTGKLAKVQSYASVSDKLKRQSSKRVRVVKKGAA